MNGITIINETSASMHVVRDYRAEDGSRVLQLGSTDVLHRDVQGGSATDDREKLSSSQSKFDGGTTAESADDDLDRDVPRIVDIDALTKG